MHPNLYPMDNHVANYTETLEVGKPHAVTGDDYSWDPTTSETRTKLKLEQLSLQDASSAVLVPPVVPLPIISSSHEVFNDDHQQTVESNNNSNSNSTNALRQQSSTTSE
eukprot:614067_1